MPVIDVLSAVNALSAIGSGISVVGSGAFTLLNYVGRAIKSAGISAYNQARTNDLHHQHSPEEISRLKEYYITQIGLKGATYSDDAFDKLIKAHPTDYNVFKDTKGLNGLSVHDKLSTDSPAAEAVNTALVITLRPPREFDEAQKNYKHSIAAIKKMAAGIPQTRSPGQLIGLMMEVRNEAVAEIKAQHLREIQKLEALFAEVDDEAQLQYVANPMLAAQPQAVAPVAAAANATDFTSQLKASLGLDNADTKGIKAVKENMLKDLKANQEKQLKDFETAANDSVKKLQSAAAVEMKTFHFLATLYRNHTDMQKVINDYRNQHQDRLPGGAVNVIVHGAENKVDFVGMSLADIPVITTVTGKQITLNRGNNGQLDGSFSMTFNGGIRDLHYRWSSDRRALADFEVMAHAVRATGKERINFDLEFKNPDIANLRGREAYEAAIKCGFPPDQIEIRINGRVMKTEELFVDHRGTLDRLNNLSPIIKKRFEKLVEVEPEKGASLKTAKDEMTKLRNTGREKEEAAAAANREPDQPHASIQA